MYMHIYIHTYPHARMHKQAGTHSPCTPTSYMPQRHRAFLQAIHNRRHLIRGFAGTRPDSAVAAAYDLCVVRMKEFRDAHIQIVAQYIVGPSG